MNLSAALISGETRRDLGVGSALSVEAAHESQFRSSPAMMRKGPLSRKNPESAVKSREIR